MSVSDTIPAPWLEVLVQAIIRPKDLCKRLKPQRFAPIGALTTRDGTPIPGARWVLSFAFHRCAVRFILDNALDGGEREIGELLEQLRNIGMDLLTTWLQAQSVYSNVRLEIDSYTVTLCFRRRGADLTPLWEELEPEKVRTNKPVPLKAFRNGTDTFLPAAWDEDFRRSLRDFDRALSFDNMQDRLIYLWRAAEEVLRAYDPRASPKSLPRHALGAEELGLYYADDPSKQVWFAELSGLAHQFARHSGRRDISRLPASFAECVTAAQSRVAEVIRRHARKLDARFKDKKFPEPVKDLLTGWRAPKSR